MQARPEIAMGEALQIEPELLNERQVELIDPAQIFGDFRIERPLRIERSTGREAHQEKRKGDDDKKRRNRRQNTRQKKTKHRLPDKLSLRAGRSAANGRECADLTK